MMVLCWACTDEEYSLSSSDKLVFSADTISMDTVFSNVPTSTKTFWVFNNNEKSIRLSTVRLEKGNQSGFRVNVDGVYLGQTTGYQTNEVEVRSGDSIRVFVELTSSTNGQDTPQLIDDNLLFNLESGQTQRVNLNAWSWDATLMNSPEITENTTLTGEKPIVVYGSMKVDEGATLTLAPGTTLYFSGDASLEVYGKLKSKGEADNEVILRGDRLDNMFDYLPYDFVSGQWGGVHFHESSYGNDLKYTDIHSTYDGVVIDSCDASKSKLVMEACTVHNCQGYGIKNENSYVELYNTQVTNTLNDCVYTSGGVMLLDNCTLAQFYPFDANRGAALRFTSEKGNMEIGCYNTLVTGYAEDVVMGDAVDTLKTFAYVFQNSILRTPKIENADSVLFRNVIFEDPTDTITSGKKHFTKIDTDNLRYDFSLDSISPAIDAADPLTAMPLDRNGRRRDDKPDIGAFERIKENQIQ